MGGHEVDITTQYWEDLRYMEAVYVEVLGYSEDGAASSASNAGYVVGTATWRRPERAGL